jgi:hypothetical protein
MRQPCPLCCFLRAATVAPSLSRGWKIQYFFFQVELIETAVSPVLLSQSGNSGALIAMWLENAIFLFRLN